MHWITHYLDDVRHGLSAMWAYAAWAGNISAGVIVFFFGSLLWPRARRTYESFLDKKLHEHLGTVLASHDNLLSAFTKRLDDHMTKVHEHIDAGQSES